MNQKTIIAILLCSFILIASSIVTADVAETEAEDPLDDVAYYDDGNVVHGDGVTFVDDMTEIDIASIRCDCTDEAFIVTLTVKDNFPGGWAEGYEYSMTIFTSSAYGAISIHYETDYYQTSPGGYASNNAYPEFSVSESSLIATIDDMIIDESTINSFEVFAKLDTADGALYIDWLPDGDEKSSDDETEDTPEDETPPDTDPVDDDTNGDNTEDTSASENTGNEVSTDSPGFGLFVLLFSLGGFIVLKKYKRENN